MKNKPTIKVHLAIDTGACPEMWGDHGRCEWTYNGGHVCKRRAGHKGRCRCFYCDSTHQRREEESDDA